MPTDHLSELSYDTKLNIENLVRTKALMYLDIEPLISEISGDYAYTLNSIIFDKYLEDSSGDLIPHQLALPPRPDPPEAPEYGLLPINKG